MEHLTTPAQTLSPMTLAAAQDPTKAQHHFSLGQVLATVMLGATDALVAYADPAKVPGSVADFVKGFLGIWVSQDQNSQPFSSPSI